MQPASGHEMLEVEIVLMIALVHSQPPQHFNATHQGFFFSFVVSKVWQMFPNFYQIFEFTLFFFPVSFVATVQKFAKKTKLCIPSVAADLCYGNYVPSTFTFGNTLHLHGVFDTLQILRLLWRADGEQAEGYNISCVNKALQTGWP
jgi:hypothetical protein